MCVLEMWYNTICIIDKETGSNTSCIRLVCYDLPLSICALHINRRIDRQLGQENCGLRQRREGYRVRGRPEVFADAIAGSWVAVIAGATADAVNTAAVNAGVAGDGAHGVAGSGGESDGGA